MNAFSTRLKKPVKATNIEVLVLDHLEQIPG